MKKLLSLTAVSLIAASGIARDLAKAGEASTTDAASALADYVAQADDSFGWKVRREGKVGPIEFAEFTLTSQTWHGITWKHQLFLLKPEKLRDASRALLFIGGGRWKDELDQPIKTGGEGLPKESTLIAQLAVEAGTPVAILLHVPFQPLFGGLTEDQLISYTFAEYLKEQDPTWPLLAPMTKSAVRAMDCVQKEARARWSLSLDHFTVTGASKRGWTTWLTAAVDPRVDAFAPMVIDMLNMGPQMKHQLATWGSFSEQIHDYTDRGLQKFLATPRGQDLVKIVDPFAYRQSLKQPKLILLGTNDRYWPLDALNQYWNDLHGEKYVLYVPNVGHKLDDYPRVIGTVSAFHRQASGGMKLPKLAWKNEEASAGLKLSLRSDIAPKGVVAWVAKSTTRDFRPAKWESVPIPLPVQDGEYLYELPRPSEGFAALFAEAIYATESMPYYLSTNVKIISAEAKKE